MKILLASIAILASASAFANEAGDERANREAFQGAATRAEVQSAYLHARAAGTLVPTGEAAALQPAVVPTSVQAREDVRREARQAARQRVVHELL